MALSHKGVVDEGQGALFGMRRRCLPALLSVALVTTPLLSAALSGEAFAFGAEDTTEVEHTAVLSDLVITDGKTPTQEESTCLTEEQESILSLYPEAVRTVVARYQASEITADEAEQQLHILCNNEELTVEQLDELLELFKSGAFDVSLPDDSDAEEENGGGSDVPQESVSDDSSGGSSENNVTKIEDAVTDLPLAATDTTEVYSGVPVQISDTAYPSSGAYTPHHYSRNLTIEKFIAVISEQAREVGQERGLYASVMIAQAILESASGNSALAQAPHNNLFGIKGQWHGQSVTMLTQEDNGHGVYYTISAEFRSYDTIIDSLNDYAALLTEKMGAFYSGAWRQNAATPADACDYLEGRYATSTSYSESLQDLIETYDLTRFDKPLDYELVNTYEMPVVDTTTGQTLLDEGGNPVMEQRTLVDLVAEASSHLGAEYVWGASDPQIGFDCSGLVQYSYAKSLGLQLPRTTTNQWKEGTTVDFNDLHMGDLLFFERDGEVYHVALYLADGYYLHAPQAGDVVKVTSMEESMPSFAQRIVETRPVGTAPAEEPIMSEPEPVEEVSQRTLLRLMTPFIKDKTQGATSEKVAMQLTAVDMALDLSTNSSISASARSEQSKWLTGSVL